MKGGQKRSMADARDEREVREDSRPRGERGAGSLVIDVQRPGFRWCKNRI